MKKAVILILCCLLAASVTAKDFNGYNVFEVTSSGGFELRPESNAGHTEFVEVILNHYAESDQGLDALPPRYIGSFVQNDNTLRWSNPASGEYDFSFTQRVTVNRPYRTVPAKVPFPLSEFPEELEHYTQPSAKIDSDSPLIKELAAELAEGYDDTYIVATRVAEWVSTNIAYNLTTLTEAVSQPASWVLRERFGVCDEIASLFIAMMRSLGVPARFVYGLSYTDASYIPTNWGAHGWAEIYFPGTGWVSFDPTYLQYGWLDSSHIKLGDALDPDDVNVRYRWSSRDIELITQPLDFHVNVIETQPGSERVRFNVEAVSPNVALGSFNQVRVRVTNLMPYYVTEHVRLQPVTDIDVVGKDNVFVTLKPGQTKEVTWLLHVSESLDPTLRYTVPVRVFGDHEEQAVSTFAAGVGFPFYDRSFYSATTEDDKNLITNVYLNCLPQRSIFYLDEEPQIDCILINKGTVSLPNLQICVEDNCESTPLLVADSARRTFTYTPDHIGSIRTAMVAEGDRTLARSIIAFDFLDRPEITTSITQNPRTIDFEEDALLEFSIKRASTSKPQNISVILRGSTLGKEWKLETLEEEHVFKIQIRGNILLKGINNLRVEVRYVDATGQPYERVTEVPIELGELSFINQFEYYAIRFGSWIESLG